MSTYEANPAGLGVGKRFGPRKVGGLNGKLPGQGSQNEIVYELVAGEPLAGEPMTFALPANYLVEKLYIEVEEAFAATSTADLSIGGGAGLTTDFDLAVAGPMLEVVTTGLANLSGTAAADIVLSVSAAALTSATGKARIVVQYKAV